MMNCRDVREQLLEANLPLTLTTSGVAEHVAQCASCAEDLARFLEAEASLRASFDAVRPSRSAAATALTVIRAVKARTTERRATMVVVCLVVGLLIWQGRSSVSYGPGAWLEQFAEVDTHSYALQCLRPATAASLVRPFLKPQRSEIIERPLGVPMLIVRATKAEHRAVANLLARMDVPGSATCESDAATRDPSAPRP